MAAAASDDDAFNGSLADETWFAFASINPVLELEETFFSIRVNVIGNAGTAEPDGFSENPL
jgi:hypothetical protein